MARDKDQVGSGRRKITPDKSGKDKHEVEKDETPETTRPPTDDKK